MPRRNSPPPGNVRLLPSFPTSASPVEHSPTRSVPMWDSSDPSRNPAPLPLNPGSSSPVTKSGASENIRAAAAALQERARESSGISPYTSNGAPTSREPSPTKSLIRDHHHKRFQSIQSNALPALQDVTNGSDGRQGRAYERSTEKSSSRNHTPSYRPLMSKESPPVSSTMLALRNTPEPSMERPLPVPRASTDLIRTAAPQVDGLSSQMISLMTICTNLQQEMAALSRRSKDNAQDLVVLKDATNARDEDIRQSLRNLVNHVTSGFEKQRIEAVNLPVAKQIMNGSEASSSPRASSKSVSLPRIPTPNSFAALTDLAMPSRETGSKPFAVDGPTNIALLEKIMRDMATKNGQEHALNLLTQLLDRAPAVTKSDALVPSRHGSSHNQRDGDYHSDHAGTLSRSVVDAEYPALSLLGNAAEANKPFASPRAADFVGGDMVKLLKKIKESVTKNGGLTAELKAGLHDLRGEILGQGRELHRQMSENAARGNGPAVQSHPPFTLEDVRQVVAEVTATSTVTGAGVAIGDAVQASMMDSRLELVETKLQKALLERLDLLEEEMQKVFHAAFESQSGAVTIPRDDGALMEMMRENFDKMRSDFAAYTERSVDTNPTAEIIDVMKNGLEALEADVKSMIGSRSEVGHEVGQEEVLEGVREEISHLQTYIDSALEKQKPQVMELNGLDDIMESLKEGFAGVKAEVERLATAAKEKEKEAERKEAERELDAAEVIVAPDPPHPDTAQKDDIKRLEVLVTTLRIKIEAMETSVVQPTDNARRADLESMESAIESIAQSMAELEKRPHSEAGSSALEAIETMLSNTKAKVDDISKEDEDRRTQLYDLQKGLDVLANTIDSIASKVDEPRALKEDIAVVESLVRELKSGMLESVERRVSDDEKVTKANIEAIETLIANTKAKLDEFEMPSADLIGTKAEIITLTALVKEAHIKAASDSAATMMAFEEYKTTNNTLASEAAASQAAVKEVKEYMESDISPRMSEAISTMDALGNLMEKVEAKIASPEIGPELADLMENVRLEVERSAGMIEELRGAGEENQTITAALMNEFTTKTSEHHENMALKIDQLQDSARDRDMLHDVSVEDLKGTAGDLKIMVDGLGSTLTSAVEKIQMDYAAVLENVSRSVGEQKAEHELTRDHVGRSVPIVEGLHRSVNELSPQLLDGLKEIKDLLTNHQARFQEFRDFHSEAVLPHLQQPTQPLLKDVAEKYDDADVQRKLDQLLEHAINHQATSTTSETRERSMSAHSERSEHGHHSESAANIDHSERGIEESTRSETVVSTGDSVASSDASLPSSHTASLHLLNELHTSFLAHAAEFAAWTGEHRDREASAIRSRERELSAAEVALARAVSEREAIESQTEALRAQQTELQKETAELMAGIAELREEHRSLVSQTSREAERLESMAVHLRERDEEFGRMEQKAEQLERRLMEGVVRYSRKMAGARAAASTTEAGVPADGEPIANMKKLKKAKHSTPLLARAGNSSSSPAAASPASKALGRPKMLTHTASEPVDLFDENATNAGMSSLKSTRRRTRNPNAPRARASMPLAGGAGRRYVSLSQMENDARQEYVATPALLEVFPESGASSLLGGSAGLRRSQSVKTGSGTGWFPMSSRQRSLALKGVPGGVRSNPEDRGRRESAGLVGGVPVGVESLVPGAGRGSTIRGSVGRTSLGTAGDASFVSGDDRGGRAGVEREGEDGESFVSVVTASSALTGLEDGTQIVTRRSSESGSITPKREGGSQLVAEVAGFR